MSLLGGIGNALKKAVKGIAKVVDNPVTRAVGTVVPGAGVVSTVARVAAGNVVRPTIPTMAAPTLAFTAPPAPTSVPSWTDIIANPIGAASQALTRAGAALQPTSSAQMGMPRKRRRMNPLNARAARRAIRRIKAVRRITRDIERSLPKQAARRRAA